MAGKAGAHMESVPMKRVLVAGIVAAMMASTGARAQQKQDDSVPYKAAELIQHWHLLVNQVFEDKKAFTSDEFVDEVLELEDQFMAAGAVRAAQDKASAEQLKKADEAIKQFAAEMVAAGEKLDNGVTRVTEESVYAAAKKICPQYPFC
jgi:hypothetical protein